MPTFRIELRKIVYEVHEVDAEHGKAALAALNEREDTLLSEEEEDSEVMSCIDVTLARDARP